jgi:hypothetical protein
MAQRIARGSLVSLLMLVLMVPPPTVMACGEGPESAESIFIQSDRPDLPFDKYAAGELGVVQPSYSQSYLVVAYRYFSGNALDASEQSQLVALWNHYLNNEDHEVLDQAGAGESEWEAALQEIAQFKAPDRLRKSPTPRFVLVSSPQTYPRRSRLSNRSCLLLLRELGRSGEKIPGDCRRRLFAMAGHRRAGRSTMRDSRGDARHGRPRG